MAEVHANANMAEIFKDLESNDKKTVEDAKQELRQLFKNVSESWLLNGLYEYYIRTNSVRSMDVLVNIKEPHHTFLFEKLCDSLKSSEMKIQALTLLGHVARAQPTWLYTLPDHPLFKDVLKLLKAELDLLPLISALLLVIVLLPAFPTKMAHYLQDLFEIFSRLAAWNCSPGKFEEDQMIHMQVALFALFLRLYGMYPCNFLHYLRLNHSREKNNPVFVHTIKPMLSSVKMNPTLVTANRDNETSNERWRKMEMHDVIVECERFSLDMTDRCSHDNCQLTNLAAAGFRSRSGTSNSTTTSAACRLEDLSRLERVSSSHLTDTNNGFFTPSRLFPVKTPPIIEASAPTPIPPHVGQTISAVFPSQEGTSPPEAAIEATPETTPIRDFHLTPGRNPPLNSTAVRALTNFKAPGGSSLHTTPTHSQPSSPMRKDVVASAFNFPESRLKRDQVMPVAAQKLSRLTQDRLHCYDSFEARSPTSPLHIGAGREEAKRTESPISQEDEEVCTIVSKHDASAPRQLNRQCDSVLHEYDDTPETLGEEQGSPCAAGGLHIPNSKSMMSFAHQISRLRYYSQCNTEPERIESPTGSTPGNGGIGFPESTTVRRTNSCPNMKKSQGAVAPFKDGLDDTLVETDEDAASASRAVNGLTDARRTVVSVSCTTQTESFWPYQFLFLSIFPSLDCPKSSPPGASSPAPPPPPFDQERYSTSQSPSIYDILDRYVETAVQSGERESLAYFKEQLQLVHQQLMFERHRRETHAYRNRRLLSDAKSTRLLEECNSALRDQVQVKQTEIENLREQLARLCAERAEDDRQLSAKLRSCESQLHNFESECRSLRESNAALRAELTTFRNKYGALDTDKQQVEAQLLDAVAEANVAKELARAGERGRSELENVNRELLLMGELHVKFRERLERVAAMSETEEELRMTRESYMHEIKEVKDRLESTKCLLNAHRERLSELEQKLKTKDNLISQQKQQMAGMAEENRCKIQAVESKYQTQLRINLALEERLLEARQLRGRHANSPDTSSCHEANTTTTATDRTQGGCAGASGAGALSAHSSPLSASLASSEGSVAFHETRELKNLQALVDQKEGNRSKADDSPTTDVSLGEADAQGASSSSSTSKHD
ncbi:hamartin isoform X2 [Aethina tumida]|uniref:hamartin isoform X2 n=1 Tax=Aethina tumida TaxID=116153 RepID=UPI00096B47D0|nr:hamartin isoform X2 [Aethina tumida]